MKANYVDTENDIHIRRNRIMGLKKEGKERMFGLV